MSKAAVEAIRENPGWAGGPNHWMRVALWAFRYSEDVPCRNDVARALVSVKGEKLKGCGCELR